MAHPEKRSRYQKAVHWPLYGYDGNGEPTVSSPQEITCRWEDVTRQIMGDNGTPIAIDAEVWVDTDVAEGSMMWKGQLIDLPDPATDIMEVVGHDEIPDVKGRVSETVLYLKRYRDSLPTVV